MKRSIEHLEIQIIEIIASLPPISFTNRFANACPCILGKLRGFAFCPPPMGCWSLYLCKVQYDSGTFDQREVVSLTANVFRSLCSRWIPGVSAGMKIAPLARPTIAISHREHACEGATGNQALLTPSMTIPLSILSILFPCVVFGPDLVPRSDAAKLLGKYSRRLVTLVFRHIGCWFDLLLHTCQYFVLSFLIRTCSRRNQEEILQEM